MSEDTAKPKDTAPEKAPADKERFGWKEQMSMIGQNMALHQRVAELEERLAKLDPDVEDPELGKARAKIARELVKLVPKAVAEAKAGKPALLRLITRTIRLR